MSRQRPFSESGSAEPDSELRTISRPCLQSSYKAPLFSYSNILLISVLHLLPAYKKTLNSLSCHIISSFPTLTKNYISYNSHTHINQAMPDPLSPDKFRRSQLELKLPYPTHDFSGQTIIVTGANVGLGFEAARHFTRLNAAKVILAVRSESKGAAAKADIESTTKRSGVVEVYPLDLSSYASVKQFAAKVSELPRVDVLLENAGIAMAEYSTMEDNESTITVNVVSTFLLAVLLLPTLRKSAQEFGIVPRICIVSSGVHARTKFAEWKADDMFATLNGKDTAVMEER